MASRAHSRAPSLGSKKDGLQAAAAAAAAASANTPVIGDDPIDPTAPQIKQTDMPRDQQTHAVQLADKAIAESTAGSAALHNSVARILKKEFDAVYGGVWQCVVGRNFGSFVVHDTQTFIYFYIGPIAVLLFRAGTA